MAHRRRVRLRMCQVCAGCVGARGGVGTCGAGYGLFFVGAGVSFVYFRFRLLSGGDFVREGDVAGGTEVADV